MGLQTKETTYNKFMYVGNHLEAYVKLEFKKDIPLENLTEQFLNGFIFYLIVEKNQAQITINEDAIKSDPKNKYMSPWHYANFEKGSAVTIIPRRQHSFCP